MTKVTLGVKLAAMRKSKGMTQADLADKMGVTDKAVSKWERDLSCPDINTLPRLAELFGISVDELIQAQSESRKNGEGRDVYHITMVVLKAVALAMGVAVIVLSIKREIDLYSGFLLLGLGLSCTAAVLLQKNGGND